MRLLIAMMQHETNTFSPVPTPLARFGRGGEVLRGAAAIAGYRGTGTAIGAYIDLAEKEGAEIVLPIAANASPSGPVDDAAYAEITDTICAAIAKGGFDGILLDLHGAMVTQSLEDGEGALLKRIRAIDPKTPVAVSLDMHANLYDDIVNHATVIVGYHTYPHVDMHLAAQRTLRILVDKAEGRARPQIAIAKLPAILPSFNMRTAEGPMAEMQQLAEDWRKRPGIRDVTIYGGFAYGDSPFAGPSAVVVADSDILAQQTADTLAQELAARRDRFYLTLPDPAEGLRRALATTGAGPAIVLDPADNPLSGGIGDTPALLRALLATDRPSLTAFGFFWDPPLVAECHRLGEGATISAKLGGRVTADFGAPVPVEARIVKLTGGKFRNEGPYEHQLPMDVGRTVLLDVKGIQVIVTESCQTPNDPAYFRLHGIDPEKLDLLCVKAKNHFRAAFAGMARCLIDVDAPGPAAASLAHYKFRHAPQGLYVGKSSD